MKIFATIISAVLFALAAPAQEKTPIIFMAKDAKITKAGFINFESKPEFQNIGGWNDTNGFVSWTVAEIPKGNYRVVITYACAGDNAGSQFEVVLGNQRANFTVASTGSWTTFKEEDLGPIIIRKAGPAEITARVTRISRRWAINIRTIKLVPES